MATNCGYTFVTGTAKCSAPYEGHLIHVGMDRIDKKLSRTGRMTKSIFADFENAWKTLMSDLKPQHRDIFREEIDFRLQDREFAFCGTLGREFIPL